MLVSESKNIIQRWFADLQISTPIALILSGIAGLALAWTYSQFGLVAGAALLVGFFTLPLLLVVMFEHQAGIYIMLMLGFMVHLLSKYTSAPVGTSMDGLLFLMLFGLLVQQSKKRDWTFAKSTISIWIAVWIAYNLLQGLNPWAESQMAWIYTVRTMAILTLLYFVACHAFSSFKAIRQTINFVIILLTAAAIYGLKQEFVGFSAAEEAWIYEDQLRFQLLFQWTRMRIFSVLNDPTTFGIMMAYGGVFSISMLVGPFKHWQKVLYAVAAILMFWTMAYTGTRTAYALVPIGLIMLVVLTLRKKILLLALIGFVLGGGALMKSTSNPLIYRIQSAFKVTDDESMQVRFENQKLIQPFIQKHPIGAGLGSTGVWGKRFTPDSWLADFPHDSGFVRIAVEQGWIGLMLYLALLFVVLHKALYYYLRVQNPEIRVFYLGIFLVLYMLSVASYPQEIIVHLPSSLIFYIFLAAIVRLKDFDPNFEKKKKKL
ncbi:MAG: O-antigen ligase family protein [Saprospiraceae bacterium]|nr:O-antigen ligase family protein [Saprospiraceae bacterium]